MKAAIWTRVSTLEQEVENQVTQLAAFAEQRTWEVVRTWRVNESAFQGNQRKALQEVYDAAHRGEFDILLVWAIDRLSRQGVRAVFEVFARLERSGVQVISYQEPWTETASPELHELILSIMAWMAKQESYRLSERTKAGLRKARERGTRLGRPLGAKDKKQRKVRGYILRYAE